MPLRDRLPLWASTPVWEGVGKCRQDRWNSRVERREAVFEQVHRVRYEIDASETRAWLLVRRNDGGPGIDRQTIEAVEAYGPIKLIGEITETLKSKTYLPEPIKRVHIPKGDGKTRPLGIPTIKDRVIQQACLLILEPIFEEDFLDCSFGYRPGRSTHHALDVIQANLKQERTQIYDADLKGYFDSIPHDKLMKAVEFRIADRQVLHLIRLWLTTPVIEKNIQGRTTRTTPKQGTPQGGVISPLLANLFLHWFDKVFHGRNGPSRFAAAHLVRFADDFVVMSRSPDRRIRAWIEEKLESWMGLTINREKTKVIDMRQPGATLDFLGYSFRYDLDRFGSGRRYWNRIPSKKGMKKAREKIHELTSPRWRRLPLSVVVERLNWFLVGWANYYRTGYPGMAFRKINDYVLVRMIKFLKHRSHRPFKLPEGISWYVMVYGKLGVKRL